MITHQPTPEQLAKLQEAYLGASHTSAAVAEARAKLALAIAEDGEAMATLSRTIETVLYGPMDDAQEPRPKLIRELSNQAARDHWPSPPPTPGG